MNCPKCQSTMEKAVYQGIEVERCTGCKGIWFDELERDDLLRLEGSEILDTGSAKIGKEFNKVDRLVCPACAGTGHMLRMVHPKQSHIWFECCKVCGGIFLDAGEFRDLKDETIFDFFKALLTPERK
ncbi:MAG: zf-TFIIB domain-containing protein [Verrucomicrobia bacterium]|nr:zf-TFIIB domain-containing protein [Verrucomicrobiota bacterium]